MDYRQKHREFFSASESFFSVIYLSYSPSTLQPVTRIREVLPEGGNRFDGALNKSRRIRMKLRSMIMGVAALCTALVLPAKPAHAQTDSALLDALVKKGVLSDQDAEDIRASEEKDYSS